MKLNKLKRIYLSQEDVPAFSLAEALEVPQAVIENFGNSGVAAPLQVAAAMKLGPNGSRFRMLCGAAIAYGLVSGGSNAASISVQPLAKRILTPMKEGDDVLAKREAFLRPRVAQDFLNRYSNSAIPPAAIAENVLVDMGVPRDKALAVSNMLVETAKELGMTHEIRGKTYIASHLSPNSVTTGDDPAKRLPNQDGPEASLVPTANPTVKDVSLPKNTQVRGAVNERAKRVLITHGKNKSFVDSIKKLLNFGELEAVVAVERQTVSEPIPDKVMADMRSCGAAIVHVDAENKLTNDAGSEVIVLNPNVLIEIGASMALYGKRFILLVRDTVTLPSNLQGLYTVRYEGETLDCNVTITLMEAINELKKRPLADSVHMDNIAGNEHHVA